MSTKERAMGANLETGLNEHTAMTDSLESLAMTAKGPDQKPQGIKKQGISAKHRGGRKFSFK